MYLENLEGKDGTWCIRFFDICGFRFIFDQVATKHQCLSATLQQQFFKGNVAKAPTWCCSWVSRTLITCWSLSDRSNIRNEPRIFQGTASFIVRIFNSLPTPVVLANPVNPLQTLSRKHHVSTFSFLEGQSSNISNICCFIIYIQVLIFSLPLWQFAPLFRVVKSHGVIFMTASYKEVSNFTFAGRSRENERTWVKMGRHCRWFRIRETGPKTSLWSLCLVCVWYMI